MLPDNKIKDAIIYQGRALNIWKKKKDVERPVTP